MKNLTNTEINSVAGGDGDLLQLAGSVVGTAVGTYFADKILGGTYTARIVANMGAGRGQLRHPMTNGAIDRKFHCGSRTLTYTLVGLVSFGCVAVGGLVGSIIDQCINGEE